MPYFRIGQALTKKKIFKIFVGSDKSRTFASRLLSNSINRSDTFLSLLSGEGKAWKIVF